jgi:CheY-like chemotaxis protein
MARTALIVDDDKHIREALREYLNGDGFEVVCAADGQEALEVLQQGTRPDVIVLDLLMPVMDGWDFRAAQLRDPALAKVPVVIISASGFSAATVVSQLKAADYLAKPLNPGMLVDVLRRVSADARETSPS